MAADVAATFGGPFGSSWLSYLKTSEESVGSDATGTRYWAAPAIPDHLSTTGFDGKVSAWPSPGVCLAGCRSHCLVNGRTELHCEIEPSTPTARTRQ